MRIFISGGCKNGKSTHAQRLAKAQKRDGGGLYYIATMIPRDDEDLARVARHQEERKGWGFTTLEVPQGISKAIGLVGPNGSVLLDSATALLANEMFREDGSVDHDAPARLAGELDALTAAIEDIVIVSDGVYSDAIVYDDLTEEYRRGLALIDRALAGRCEVVLEACYGSLIAHKGGLIGELEHEIY